VNSPIIHRRADALKLTRIILQACAVPQLTNHDCHFFQTRRTTVEPCCLAKLCGPRRQTGVIGQW
jgi:hypothetical protein